MWCMEGHMCYVVCLTCGSLLLMQSVGLTKSELEFLISTCQQ